MRPRHDRKLRGHYALFFLGHVHEPDEPFFVGHDSPMLLTAADGLWGDGWAHVGPWATAADRECTLREVHRLRTERLAVDPDRSRFTPATAVAVSTCGASPPTGEAP